MRVAVGTSGEPAPDAIPARRAPGVPSLRANFAWTFAGNAVYAASQWAMLVVVARLAHEAAVGQLALGFAVTAPIFLLAGLQLRAVQTTDAASAFRFADCFGVTVTGVSAGLLATAVIVLSSGYGAQTGAVVLAVAGCKAIEGITDIHYGQLQRREWMRPIAVSLMARGLLGILAMAAVLRATGNLLWTVAALGIAWATVLVVQTIRPTLALVREARERYAPRFHLATMRRILWVALPLGVVMMLVSLRANIPRYVVDHSSGAAELGVFAALSSLVAAGNLVINALSQSAIPRLARHFHEGDLAAFRSLLAKLMAVATAIGAAGVLGAIVLGRPMLLILFGPSYAARSDLLVWLMIAGAVSYAAGFLGTAVTSTRRFRVQLPLFASSSGATALLCLWLVPRHGLTGAAVAWGAVLFLELVAMAAILAVTLRRRARAGALS